VSLHPWPNRRESEHSPRRGDLSLARLRDEIDSLFERFLREPWGSHILESLPARLGMAPRIDLTEDEDQVTLEAELPGVEPDDVQINVASRTLTISGNKKPPPEAPEGAKRQHHYAERQFGEFQRHVELPGSVDPDRVNALYKNGVLIVTLAKRPEAKPRHIAISQG